MCLRDERAQRIRGLVSEPLREVVRVVDARDRDGLRGPGVSDRGYELLRAGGGIARLVRAPVEEARPAHDRLAPYSEEDVGIALEGGCDRGPERRAVVRVRRGRL